jgi:hypothetical protein
MPGCDGKVFDREEGRMRTRFIRCKDVRCYACRRIFGPEEKKSSPKPVRGRGSYERRRDDRSRSRSPRRSYRSRSGSPARRRSPSPWRRDEKRKRSSSPRRKSYSRKVMRSRSPSSGSSRSRSHSCDNSSCDECFTDCD